MSNERDKLAEDIRGLGITVIDGPPVDLSEPLAQHLHNLGYRKPRTITTTEELDTLPLQAIVALISHSRNVPFTVVFHRGSNEFGGDGWCTPEAIGQIPSEAVFEFIGLNGFPPELTVLHEGRTA
ncbi:hypothetical protein M707_02590 [Arthrobacter sp. AK-YN10]|nr:hypothetical protein M707_02590 [Arthrobacter sp. AK-YN10]